MVSILFQVLYFLGARNPNPQTLNPKPCVRCCTTWARHSRGWRKPRRYAATNSLPPACPGYEPLNPKPEVRNPKPCAEPLTSLPQPAQKESWSQGSLLSGSGFPGSESGSRVCPPPYPKHETQTPEPDTPNPEPQPPRRFAATTSLPPAFPRSVGFRG